MTFDWPNFLNPSAQSNRSPSTADRFEAVYLQDNEHPEPDWAKPEEDLFSQSPRVPDKAEAEVLRVRASVGARLVEYEAVDKDIIYAELDGVQKVKSKMSFDHVKIYLDVAGRNLYMNNVFAFDRDNAYLVRIMAQYTPVFDKAKYEQLRKKYGKG
jgi:hypothetical protein